MKLCFLVTLAISAVSPRQEQSTLSFSSQTDHNFTKLQSAALSSTNLQDSDDFYVCGSKVFGMDGRYVLQPPDVVQSDIYTPVFAKVNQNHADALTDFRLYRHNGFWLIANVESWPPVTHFRCDPTKSQVFGVDILELCRFGKQVPPRSGYTPATPRQGNILLTLHHQVCQS
ncbi:uncharacterized protein PHALS_12572 [Plasmopara halstedii]|uniref:RxLR-like protein n=1 Tax=Plasmopara halstedii TaxID=4781 RepID=A0A0P1AMJ7_PLAHL|nr:uncharacterized protein PHALS_12572 [Plasmopara halstedii]CEG42284.1 hypothetical protein PHALS_12572 [Plasmopara halstedii]|eukprot:XP_024578653.1 hypothetical protein PHALS_12572 [Plasmopara halstedii]